MNMRHVILALALALPMTASASQCPALMAKIDQLIASGPKVDEETLKEVKELREDGEKAHKDGKHDKSVENLNQALLLLGAL